MSARKIALLMIALLIAVGTALLAKSMMANKAPDGTPVAVAAPKTTEILVAARDLPSGTLIKAEDMKWQIWPEDEQAQGLAFKGKSDVADYAGAVVRQGLRAGEPIMAGRVVRKQDQGFMAAVLNPGKRAVSVSLTPVGGVAGFVFPGDHVDVIVTHQLGRKAEAEIPSHKVAETILTNVRVLALDQQASDQMTEPKVAKIATLEVAPKQAEALALVAEMGTISLSLRSLAVGDADEQPGINMQAVDAARRAIGMPALHADAPADGRFTWDSDVSQVLSGPANRRGTLQRVQIMRGKETTETVFDLPQ